MASQTFQILFFTRDRYDESPEPKWIRDLQLCSSTTYDTVEKANEAAFNQAKGFICCNYNIVYAIFEDKDGERFMYEVTLMNDPYTPIARVEVVDSKYAGEASPHFWDKERERVPIKIPNYPRRTKSIPAEETNSGEE